jgi:hypothetical protein
MDLHPRWIVTVRKALDAIATLVPIGAKDKSEALRLLQADPCKAGEFADLLIGQIKRRAR